MATLKERLKARSRPTSAYALRVEETQGPEMELVRATQAHRRAVASGAGVEEAAARQEEAQAAFDACFEVVRLVAMRADEYEALLAAHPPRKGNKDDEAQGFNGDSFIAALLAECAVDADMDADEWADALAELSFGERTELRIVVQALNVRTPVSSVPKG